MKRKHDENGQASLELAIIVPILALFAAGAMDIGRVAIAARSVILDPDRISVSDVAIDGSQSTKEQGLAASEWDELRVSRATESVNRTSIKATVTYRFEGVLPGIGTADVQRRVDGLRISSYRFEVS